MTDSPRQETKHTRVLHVIDSMEPGGAESVFIDLALTFDDASWRSFAALPRGGWAWDELVRRGVEPSHTEIRKRPFDVAYLVRLIRLIRRYRIDLVQTHLLGPAIYGTLAGLACRVPTICTFHGAWDLQGTRLHRLKSALLRRGARRVVYVSESLRETFLARGFGDRSRSRVIMNGLPADFVADGGATPLREELGVGPDGVLVGAIGNVRPPKAYDVLMQSAARLRDSVPGLKVAIVGDTDAAEYRRLLEVRRAIGLEETVTFTGFRSDVARILSALDVFVSTSRDEGFSLVTIEAMAAGVPVVVTRCGGPEEIVTDGMDGLLVDVDAPDQVAGAIARCLYEPGLRARLTAAGRETVRTRFAPERMYEQYRTLYRECVESDP